MLSFNMAYVFVRLQIFIAIVQLINYGGGPSSFITPANSSTLLTYRYQ